MTGFQGVRCALTVGIALLMAAPGSAGRDQQPPVNAQAAALKDFSDRLQEYLKLRAKLSKTLEPLSETPSAAELKANQDALAAAIRHARADAQPGDLVTLEVQQQIRRTIQADQSRRQPAENRAAMKEVPDGPLPGINKTYPDRAALPTVPPLLLASLPQLPDNLQYRYFGRHLVILDGDVEIVVDYVRNALPR